jgi:hypothetical protein
MIERTPNAERKRGMDERQDAKHDNEEDKVTKGVHPRRSLCQVILCLKLANINSGTGHEKRRGVTGEKNTRLDEPFHIVLYEKNARRRFTCIFS